MQRMTRYMPLSAFLLFFLSSRRVTSLSVPEASRLARGRLHEGLASPSGKLTLSPEIVVPEPKDATSILLQANALSNLSEKIRVQAKSNSAWISGSVSALQTFCSEQEQARGNFPGPVPVIYCDAKDADAIESVAKSGAAGVLVRVDNGNEVSSLEDIPVGADASWVQMSTLALESGLQPIPEVTIGDSTAATWGEDDITSLVGRLTNALSGEEPVSVLLTINPPIAADDDTEEEFEHQETSLPQVPKQLGKRVPILGSVRVPAGNNRIGSETARFKDAGFTGCVLRSDCVPGFRMNPDLEFVGKFWSSCIGDLKSTKSKTFEFRTRNELDKLAPLEWMKYQKDVIDSGALGSAEDNMPPPDLDESSGDYMGF